MLTDNEVRDNIAANVRRILHDRGWSQSELARRAGENPMIISRICRGNHVPHAGIVCRVAEALDVTVDRLVNPAPEPVRQTA